MEGSVMEYADYVDWVKYRTWDKGDRIGGDCFGVERAEVS